MWILWLKKSYQIKHSKLVSQPWGIVSASCLSLPLGYREVLDVD